MTLTRTGFIPVPPGPAPGFDHADVYADGAVTRMYVAHTGADRVEVIDCASGRWLRSLPDHPGVAGVLADSATGLLFTSDRAAAQVTVYQCPDETIVARLGVGPHPNGLAYDPRRGRLFSFNLGEPLGQNCTASVIDLARQQVIATIPLPGRPRWAVYDPAADRVCVNIREPAQILIIEAGDLTAGMAFGVPAEGPHGLWLADSRLYCACDGRALIVTGSGSGAVQARVPLPGGPDVVMHDPELNHLYVAIGDPGVIAVVDTSTLELAEIVPTESGAHTIGLDASRHTVYAFLPASGGAAVYQDR